MKDHWQRAGAHAGLQSPQSHLEVWVVYRLETAGSLSRGRARSSSIWIASRRFGVFDQGTDWTWQTGQTRPRCSADRYSTTPSWAPGCSHPSQPHPLSAFSTVWKHGGSKITQDLPLCRRLGRRQRGAPGA